MRHRRRDILALGAAAMAAGACGARAAQVSILDARIAAFTRGAAVGAGGITLTLAGFAENGVSVPVAFDAPGAVAVLLLAPANPDPQAAIFRFGPRAGAQSAETRIRLAESQTVRAIAALPGGRFTEAQAAIVVALGGCEG